MFSEIGIFLLNDGLRQQPLPARTRNTFQNDWSGRGRYLYRLLFLLLLLSSELGSGSVLVTWLGNYRRVEVEAGRDHLEYDEEHGTGRAANETSRSKVDV